MSLQALIFDVDGTLADTEGDGHRPAYNAAFHAAGLDWDWTRALYGELLQVTGGKERIRHYIQQYRPDFTPPVGQGLEQTIVGLYNAKTRFFADIVAAGHIPARSGVVRLLGEARQAGLRLAIATTTDPMNVQALLRQVVDPQAESWFEVIGAGDIVAKKKPAPDIYQYVLQALGLPGRDCLAFEDSHHGLVSARGAGVTTVITVNDYTRGQDFTGAQAVLDQLGEPDRPFQVLAGQAPVEGSVCLDRPYLYQLSGVP